MTRTRRISATFTRPSTAVLRLAFLLSIAAAGSSCSRAPSLEGGWKNADGNTLTFTADSVVLLGQEGLEGDDSGRYVRENDEIRIVTEQRSDQLGSFHNEYYLQLRRDTIFLRRLALYRGGDYHEITLDSLSKSMGRPAIRFAFTRTGKK